MGDEGPRVVGVVVYEAVSSGLGGDDGCSGCLGLGKASSTCVV
jgi:hypothetical protein